MFKKTDTDPCDHLSTRARWVFIKGTLFDQCLIKVRQGDLIYRGDWFERHQSQPRIHGKQQLNLDPINVIITFRGGGYTMRTRPEFQNELTRKRYNFLGIRDRNINSITLTFGTPHLGSPGSDTASSSLYNRVFHKDIKIHAIIVHFVFPYIWSLLKSSKFTWKLRDACPYKVRGAIVHEDVWKCYTE